MSSYLPTVKESVDPGALNRKIRRKAGINAPDPALPYTPPPPTIEDTEGAQQDEADRLRRRRGRAASVLTQGQAGVPQTAGKVLLGS